MKDEIKEIIRLNCDEEIDVKYFAKDDSLVDTTMDYSQLLDYITNLQEQLEIKNEGFKSTVEELCETSEKLEQLREENERLKEIIKDNTILVKDENGNYQECNINLLDYKSRIDKAIEYIEERKNLNWYADGVFVYDLLNILNGEYEE